jgi:hypothetical protein|tara:strand:- start:325 stop:972 length:648 start_codon:yes stop_codon:yes gene_type:complete
MIKLTIPTSLKDITLRDYKKFLDVEKENKDDRFLNAKLIHIFCKISLEKVMLLELKDAEDIVKTISDMFNEKPALVKKFKIGKTEYGFHPELDSLTLGEYIDLDTFIGDWDNMEKAMNVLYRPILVTVKERYSIDEYNVDNFADALDMPMDAVMSSIFFLWNLGLELSTVMTNYLDSQETELLTQHLSSQKNGVGTEQFLHSLKATLDDFKISLN